MSAKTKIVVLHMKELIYTVVFVVLGILLVLLMIYMFLPGKKEETSETMKYVAGVYTSSITFQDSTVDVEVVVDSNHINSISLKNLNDTIATMYPLMEPAIENISEQVCAAQSTDHVTYADGNQYTSMVLLNAVKDALAKAETGK